MGSPDDTTTCEEKKTDVRTDNKSPPANKAAIDGSSALVKNNITPTIIIPPEHRVLISISESMHGINIRVQNFLNEFHHVNTNPEDLIKLLRDVVLKDLWFYISQPSAGQALTLLIQIFQEVLNSKKAFPVLDRAVQTLMEFMDLLYRNEQHELTAPLVEHCLTVLEDVLANHDHVNTRSSSHLKIFTDALAMDFRYQTRLTHLLKASLLKNLEFWEKTSDIDHYFGDKQHRLKEEYRLRIPFINRDFYSKIRKKLNITFSWSDLSGFVDFNGFTEMFRRYIDQLELHQDRIYYILFLLRLPGMTHLKDPLLWDLNRSLRSVQKEFSNQDLIVFIKQIFIFFEDFKARNMNTVMDCILTLGKEIYASQNAGTINSFTDELIRFGFVSPQIYNIGADWQTKVDPNHVKNIRLWLELIECNPSLSTKLLSALIVNLKLDDPFISDTDLFQRDITKLLNANIKPVFKLIKQVTRLFPVYFNEIGAEGELREVTTIIDEFSGRQDRLIHFLRKQVHTESNNTNLRLARRIARFWYDGSQGQLRNNIPYDVRDGLSTIGRWYEPTHKAMVALCRLLKKEPEQLLEIDPETLRKAIGALPPQSDSFDIKRPAYLVELYRLLRQKYTIDEGRIIPLLRHFVSLPEPEIAKLETALEANDYYTAIKQCFILMTELKIILLNPEPSIGREDIYYKRHIAAGIPSMYGQYREPKFEALGLTFRLEKLVVRLFDQCIDTTKIGYITTKTIGTIRDLLKLYQEGLELDGVSHPGMKTTIEMIDYSLSASRFSLYQFVNLFQILVRDVKDVITDNFLGSHDETLRVIVTQKIQNNIDKGSIDELEIEQIIVRQSEEFYRELISSAFLIQHLDSFLSRILEKLHSMVKNLKESMLKPEMIQNVMDYNPSLIVSPIYENTPTIDNQIFLGAKGYFLKKLYSFGFPVPPGFILTTELYRYHRAISCIREMFEELIEIVMTQVQELEKWTGKKFGDPTNPLLLSVRSGAAISLPGAMNTFLNVGMNDRVTEVLSQQHNYGWTSWDCYRRFLQSWGMTYGIPRDEFDLLMVKNKNRFKVTGKIFFTPDQMRTIASEYKDVLVAHGVSFSEDPGKQLMQAIFAVLNSWYTERANIYRKQLQIAEEWGTAVIVQAMVLGNINLDSGTGVVFTHDPFIPNPGINLFGDFTMCSQGEDVVAGLVHTLPISERQRQRSPSFEGKSLEKDCPEIYQELRRYAEELIKNRGFGHQEIEFTFESSKGTDLYILQTRNHSPRTKTQIPVFTDPELQKNALGSGIGMGIGAMNGLVAFDMEDLKQLTKMHPGVNRILVRPDTVPDDIPLIFKCDGLLTARGGVTSHAAVTAVRLGKTCIVGCRTLIVDEKEKRFNLGGVEFRMGDPIAIDGRLGNIYKGNYPTEFAPIKIP